MSSVPQPHRGVDLILGGAGSLTDSLGQRRVEQKAEADANRPINPLQQQMLELVLGGKRRIEAGEDPAKVAAELREHPIAQQYRQSAQGGGLAAPAAAPVPGASNMQAYPDIGMQNGRPQMAMPGTFDPTRASPSLGAPPAQPQPRGPVSGALDMSPDPSRMARISAAPVMTGATQPPRQEFGSQPSPSLGQAPTPPQPQAPYVPTQRDYASVSPMFPTIMAAQGRQQVAEQNAAARQQVAETQANTATFLGMLKAQGMDDNRASREAIEFAKLDVRQQQAVLSAATKLDVAKIGADSRLGAAQIGAGSRERVASTRGSGKSRDELGAQIKALRSQISGLGRADTITAPKGTQEALDSAREQLKALEAEWNERNLGALPQQGAPPAAPGAAKIKVRLKNGKLGLISPQHFNPATMTKE